VSAKSAAQFTIGRIITYGMTGMAIVVVPIYQAETAPRVLRGMFGSTIQLMIVFGQLIATLITFGTQHMKDSRGWHIPIGLQLLMPSLILALLPFLPESPRWLLSRGRREDAVRSMKRLRHKMSDEEIELEMKAIAYVYNIDAEGGQSNRTSKNNSIAGWWEVFNEKNRRRTGVAVLAMLGQQITGQAFPSQYGVIFYQSQGFGSRAFLFNVISNIVGLVAVVITWFYVDAVGRRPVLLVGGSMMAAFLYILGGMGVIGRRNMDGAERNLTVASLMMFSFSYNLSWAPVLDPSPISSDVPS
jgi:MFS transporter, SP family, sugar:H+ symporter